MTAKIEFEIYTEEAQKANFMANPNYSDKTSEEKEQLWKRYQGWINGWLDVLDAVDC